MNVFTTTSLEVFSTQLFGTFKYIKNLKLQLAKGSTPKKGKHTEAYCTSPKILKTKSFRKLLETEHTRTNSQRLKLGAKTLICYLEPCSSNWKLICYSGVIFWRRGEFAIRINPLHHSWARHCSGSMCSHFGFHCHRSSVYRDTGGNVDCFIMHFVSIFNLITQYFCRWYSLTFLSLIYLHLLRVCWRKPLLLQWTLLLCFL